MPTDKKLIIAVLVLAALGGAVFLQNKNKAADAQAHSIEGIAQNLPKLSLSEEDVKKLDKVELTRPAEGDGGAQETIVLVKKGDEAWDVEKPVPSKGNASNVKSMLDDLKKIEAKELIDSSKDSYAKYKLTDQKALHAVFYAGKDVKFDAYFGEDGSRGQMTRVAGKDGVYAVKGYSSYSFNRDAKAWRDKTILTFEEKDVNKASLDNENGSFTFEKAGEDWKVNYSKTKGGQGTPVADLDKTKVESFIRAFKSLSAADFGDGKKPEDLGLAPPKSTLVFDAGGTKYTLLAGDAEGSNRWIKKDGAPEIFSISSWSGDWAVAKPEKFQKTKDGDKKEAAPAAPAGMPPGMPPGMPQMPPHG
jgi:hypothetical protein